MMVRLFIEAGHEKTQEYVFLDQPGTARQRNAG